MENASARNLWGDFLDAHLEFASEDAPNHDPIFDQYLTKGDSFL